MPVLQIVFESFDDLKLIHHVNEKSVKLFEFSRRVLCVLVVKSWLVGLCDSECRSLSGQKSFTNLAISHALLLLTVEFSHFRYI